MRCRECGLEVEDGKAFCPVCGAPMKVTADYEYIQAEIANKVGRYFNEEKDTDSPDSGYMEEDPQDDEEDVSEEDIPNTNEKIPRVAPERRSSRKTSNNRRGSRNSRSRAGTDELAKTRPLYGSDSIFEEDFYEEEEEQPPVRKPRETAGHARRPAPRRPEYVPPRPRKKDQTVAKIVTVLVIFIIIAAAAVGIMAISGVFNRTARQQSQSQQTASLTSNITAGETYEAPVQIEITTASEGNIFYTLDGSEPSINSRMYQGPISISAADVPKSYPQVNLRAVSYGENSQKSGDLNVVFYLEYDESDAAVLNQTTEPPTEQTVMEVNPPQISPASGSYASDTEILVSAESGAQIYYTYDGSMPTTSSQPYTGPVQMLPGTSVFSAIAVLDGTASEAASNTFTLEYGYNTSSGQAMTSVINDLLYSGYINDYDGNTSDGYTALRHEGVHNIGDYTYYIIRVDFYNANGELTNSLYRGVGVNYGNVYNVGFNGDSYYLDY